MNPRKAVRFLAFLLFASVPLALAQGTYTQIDYPGALGTELSGIDTAGDITGYYYDSSNHSHGFLLKGSTYTNIDYPGATDTYLLGINDAAQEIVGVTLDIGFAYDIQSQAFTTISYPGAAGAVPSGVNDTGTIAGTVEWGRNRIGGFELAGSGRGQRIVAPGGIETFVYGVSASGEAVGYYVAANGGYVSFAFNKGKIRLLHIPNSPDAQVLGINPAGTALVGWSGTGPAGFLYQNRILQTLEFPSSFVTVPSGINTAGEVVGYFQDSSFTYHGFTWTPPANAAKK